MRIGLSSTTFEPALTQSQIDGIGVATQQLYQELIKRGQTVIPCYYPNRQQVIKPELAGSQSLGLPYTWSTLLAMLTPLTLNSGLEKQIDLYHATDHMVPKFKRIPTIATIHDALMFSHPNWHSMRLGGLKKIARKKSFSWANHFITISETMKQEAIQFAGIKEDNISVVYNGISPTWFEKIPAATRQAVLHKFQLPEQFVLFTGTLQHKKNLPRLIQAYLQLPTDIQDQYPLVVVGRAGWGTEESLAAIEQLTTQKRGYWLKYIATDELRALFQSATLYAHPSLHEGFGLTLLEAFASETPVLTSNLTALPEIASDAAYLLDPYSIAEITKGMQLLLTHPAMREDLVRKGKIRVQDFSWEKCTQETLQIYQTVLNRG